VRACASIEAAAASADAIVSAVPAGAASAVAAACAPSLRHGCVYVDPAPLAPAEKTRLAALIEAAGAQYVDLAVLVTVAASGAAVPTLAAGLRGAALERDGGSPGFDVAIVEGPAGRASLVKLVRSVYMKGRDALILEMVLAARHHGVEEVVLASIAGPGEEVPFADLAKRVITSLAVYSERRAEELEAAAYLVGEAASSADHARGRGSPALDGRARAARTLRRRAAGRRRGGARPPRRARSNSAGGRRAAGRLADQSSVPAAAGLRRRPRSRRATRAAVCELSDDVAELALPVGGAEQLELGQA
jgi:hypothetical protein